MGVQDRVLRSEGWATTLLLSASGSASPAVLLPDGRLIYSRIDQPDLYQVLFQGCSLWEVRADLRTGLPRSEPRTIAASPFHDLLGLNATADGKRLAFLKK